MNRCSSSWAINGSAAVRYQPGEKAFERDESVHVQHERTSLTMPMPSCPITSAASGQGQLLAGTAVPTLAPTDFFGVAQAQTTHLPSPCQGRLQRTGAGHCSRHIC